MTPTSETYTIPCARCGYAITSSPDSRAEANAESQANFGFAPSPSTRAVICDDCYQVFVRWLDGLSEQERERLRLGALAMEPS